MYMATTLKRTSDSFYYLFIREYQQMLNLMVVFHQPSKENVAETFLFILT